MRKGADAAALRRGLQEIRPWEQVDGCEQSTRNTPYEKGPGGGFLFSRLDQHSGPGNFALVKRSFFSRIVLTMKRTAKPPLRIVSNLERAGPQGPQPSRPLGEHGAKLWARATSEYTIDDVAGVGPRRRLSDALARSLQSQRSRSKKGLAFGRKRSMCGRPHALRCCGRTLRPDNRCDPGLASVRGRDWPAPEARAFKSCPSNSMTRNLCC